MIDFHQERKAKVTIALTPVDDPTSYGLIETNPEGGVTRFIEKPSWEEVTTNMINAGTYVLGTGVLTQIPPETEVSFERKVFPQLLAQGEPIYAYPSSAYWIDIGTPGKYLQLHRDLLGGKCQQYTLVPSEDVLIGEPSDVHPSAQMKGPAIIGANCSIGHGVKLTGPVVIGTGCTILEDSVIEDSIIWQNARLGPRISLKKSILANNCYLKAGSICQESVLGDNVTVVSDYKLKPGSRIEPGTVVKPET
jgi:mannose-1-phosphate guanylyltransferase